MVTNYEIDKLLDKESNFYNKAYSTLIDLKPTLENLNTAKVLSLYREVLYFDVPKEWLLKLSEEDLNAYQCEKQKALRQMITGPL